MAAGKEVRVMYPTWQEIFNKPPMSTCAVECPDAWQGDSITVHLADKEWARQGVNALFEPPITEEEIEEYARYFKMSKRQAELEIREGRRELDADSYTKAAA
jgi:hypothetical protein